MFSSKPFFKENYQSKTIDLSLSFEDSNLCQILSFRQLQAEIGHHVSFKGATISGHSRLYELYLKYPKALFFLKRIKQTLSCTISYSDFGFDIRAERPENLTYLGINLDKIREESDCN